MLCCNMTLFSLIFSLRRCKGFTDHPVDSQMENLHKVDYAGFSAESEAMFHCTSEKTTGTARAQRHGTTEVRQKIAAAVVDQTLALIPAASSRFFSSPELSNFSVSSPPPMNFPSIKTRGTLLAPVNVFM